MNTPIDRPLAHRHRRRGWNARELLLLATSALLIVSPLIAIGVALLRPQTTAAQTADLRVSKIATSLIGGDLTSIGPGQEFYYQLTVQTGSTSAVDVNLSDTFPATVEPVAIRDQNGGECSLSGNQLTCSLTMTSLRPASVLVQSRLSSSAAVGS